jgi:hypothetical protein
MSSEEKAEGFEKDFLEKASLLVELYFEGRTIGLDLNASSGEHSKLMGVLRGQILNILLGFGISRAFKVEDDKKYCVSVNVGGDWRVIASGLEFEGAGEVVGLLMSAKPVHDVRIEVDSEYKW